jgi:hypothetical protein
MSADRNWTLPFETLTIVIGVPIIGRWRNGHGHGDRGNSDNFTPLVVNLASNDASEAVPAAVLIPANQASASFTITAVMTPCWMERKHLRHRVRGRIRERSVDRVTDKEILTVAITAASISENGGTTTGTVTR